MQSQRSDAFHFFLLISLIFTLAVPFHQTTQPPAHVNHPSESYKPNQVLVGMFAEALGMSHGNEISQKLQHELEDQLGYGKLRFLMLTSMQQSYGSPQTLQAFPTAHIKSSIPSQSVALFTLEMSGGSDIDSALKSLRENPVVAFAEPDFQAVATTIPGDPRFGDQWGLTKIQAPQAWDTTTGGSDTVIAVIDSGIQVDHEDLTGQLWNNPAEIPGNGLDDDHNGFIDDVHGANILTKDGNIADSTGHGTQVAGVIAASANNAKGIAGVCWNCRLMVVKVVGATGTANYSDIAAGVNYAAKMGAKVINISLGGYSDSTTLKTAIQAAAQTAVIVAGAGNDNLSTPFYPAAYTDSVLAVAGTASDDSKHSASNYGSWIRVSAPGENILTTDSGGSYYSPESGTSLAAPFVSGLAGLLVSQNPSWSPTLVRQQIWHTTDSIDSANPAALAGKLGSGRINAVQAVTVTSKPNLKIQDFTAGGRLSGTIKADGSTVSLWLTLSNDWLGVSTATAVLTADSPAHVTKAGATFTSATDLLSMTNSADPFQVTVDPEHYGENLTFHLQVTAAGQTQTLNFIVMSESQTLNYSGSIASNTTWLSSRSYHVTGNLTIKNTAVLTIEPGAQIQVDPGYFIKVEGTLIADGTAQAPIVFTTSSAAGAHWVGLTFTDLASPAVFDGDGIYQSGSILRFVEVSYADNGVMFQTKAPYFTNDWFINNTNGITQNNLNSPRIESSIFTNNTNAININQGGFLTIFNNQFISNGKGIYLANIQFSSSNPIIKKNSFLNSGTAITLSGGGQVSENILLDENHTTNGMLITTPGNGQVDIYGNRVSGYSTAIYLFGTNIMNMQHNLIFGNGTICSPQPCNNSPAVYLTITSSSSVVTDNTIMANVGPGLLLAGSQASNLSIHYNNLLGNGIFDLKMDSNTGRQTIVATDNYWGNIQPGEIGGRIYDCNDDPNTSCGASNATLGEVIYDPALTSPSVDAPAFVTSSSFDPDTVGLNQPGTMTLNFSRAMDPEKLPSLTFHDARRGLLENLSGTTGAMQIARDPSGAVWFACNSTMSGGTPWGIKRFDGVNWTTYNTTNGLVDNRVLGLLITKNGEIWASHNTSATARLSHFSGGAWSTLTTDDVPGGPAEDYVQAMAEDKSGNIWFILNYSIARFNGVTWKTYTQADLPMLFNPVSSMASDGQGRIWISHVMMPGSGSVGLSMFDGITWTSYTPGNGLPINATTVGNLFGDSNGRLWFSFFTDHSILGMVEGSTWNFFNQGDAGYPLNTTSLSFADSPDGKVWIAYTGTGPGATGEIAIYDGSRFTTLRSSATAPFTFDLKGNLFMAGNYNTVARVLWAGDDFSFDTGTWLSPTSYQASYNFTGLVPPGTYQPVLSSAYGTDGVEAYSGSLPTFKVDYAGQVSETTPPPAPWAKAIGKKGVPGYLQASWTINDPKKQVDGYRYAIGTSRGATNILYWTTVSQSSVERYNLPLVNGQKYWISVQAHNLIGLWGDIGSASFISGSSTTFTFIPSVKK